MRRLARYVGYAVGVVALVLAAAFGAAYLYVAHPSDADATVPDGAVSLESRRGRQLLEESRFRADFEPLERHFDPQIYRSYCGVATAATLVRSEGHRASQRNFFDRHSNLPVGGWDVFFSGLTLRELHRTIESAGLESRMRYAGKTSVASFRRAARRNLGSRGDWLVVNYDRQTAGQLGGGHISPVAAYHEASDRLLVYDTADYKYPPTWLKVGRLFRAMATTDDASGRSRGYLLVE